MATASYSPTTTVLASSGVGSSPSVTNTPSATLVSPPSSTSGGLLAAPSGGGNTLVIAGAAGGGGLCILLSALAIFCLLRMRSKKEKRSEPVSQKPSAGASSSLSLAKEGLAAKDAEDPSFSAVNPMTEETKKSRRDSKSNKRDSEKKKKTKDRKEGGELMAEEVRIDVPGLSETASASSSAPGASESPLRILATPRSKTAHEADTAEVSGWVAKTSSSGSPYWKHAITGEKSRTPPSKLLGKVPSMPDLSLGASAMAPTRDRTYSNPLSPRTPRGSRKDSSAPGSPLVTESPLIRGLKASSTEEEAPPPSDAAKKAKMEKDLARKLRAGISATNLL
jgi:hypothetical protein